MGPCQLENRLVFLWIESVAGRVDLRRYGTEQICRELWEGSAVTGRLGRTHHADYLGIYPLCEYSPLCRDVLQHLMQSLHFDLLALQFAARVVEVKDNSALLKFLHEKFVSLFWSNLCEAGQGTGNLAAHE